MAAESYVNSASTTLNGGITDSQTSLTVASASGFPLSGNFRIQIDDELLLVTAGHGTTSWTVTRGVESADRFPPAAHSDGAKVRFVVTAASLRLLNGPTLIVAGNDASDKMKTNADALCDGTADNYEIQAALDVVQVIGGEVKLEGTFYLADMLTITQNKRVRVNMQGARIVLGSGVTGFKINQGCATTRGAILDGGIIDGLSDVNTTGVLLEDTNWPVLRGVQLENCGRGILEHSATANNFVEGVTLTDVVIRNSRVYGIEFRRTSGTNSFGQHVYTNVSVVVGAGTGVYVAPGCSIYRSRMQIGVWVMSNLTGFSFDGDFDNAVLDIFVEGQTGSTGNTALTIGTNATNLDKAHMHLSWWGTVNTIISNAFNKDFAYQQGRTFFAGVENSTSWRLQGHGAAGPSLIFGRNGTAGGRMYWCSGSGTNDCYIERYAAATLKTTSKFLVGSLGVGNSVAAATPGSVTKKIEVFDASGNSLGFIAVYDAIT